MARDARPVAGSRRLLLAWVAVPLGATMASAVLPLTVASMYRSLLDLGFRGPSEWAVAAIGALVLLRAGWMWWRVAGIGWRWVGRGRPPNQIAVG